MTTMKITSKDLIVYLLIGIVYYALISQYVGAVDDVMYSYMHTIIGDKLHYDWGHPIKSLSDAIYSQSCDYKLWNGRVVNHTIIQLLCGNDWGKPVFFLLSSIFYVLLILGIQHITLISTKRKINILPIIALTILLTPSIGTTYLGNISFVVNYLWTSTVTVWVLYYFFRLSKENVNRDTRVIPFIALPILFLCGGIMHEGFSIPISAFFLLYCIKHFKDIRRNLLILILIYWLTSLIVITAPANFIRLNKCNGDAETLNLLMQLLGHIKAIFYETHQAIILLLMGISLTLLHKKRIINIAEYIPFIIILIIALAFDIGVAYVGEHQLIPICLMEIIIFSIILSKLNIQQYVHYAVCGATVIFIGTTLYYRILWANEWNKMHEDIASENKDNYEATKLYNLRNSTPKIIMPFTQANNALRHIMDEDFFVRLSAIMATNGKNTEKIKTILPAPKAEILNIANNTTEVSPGIYTNGKYLVLKVHKNNDKAIRVKYQYNQSLAGRLLYNYGLRQPVIESIEPAPCHSFEDSDYIYYIVFIEHESLKNVTMCHD